MTISPRTLGFIGIGLMGEPLVLRLLNADFPVHVWNRSPAKLANVIAAGATAHEQLSSLVTTCDILILCLANTQVVENIVKNHIFPYAVAGKLLIDLSSIHPETTRQLAEQSHQRGMRWVDAPVSGGTLGAAQGTLAIMAGGDAADIDIARQVLKPLYQQLTHMGAVGSGQVTKICNQMLVSCNVLVIAEMIKLAQLSGVDATKIPQALAGGFADSKPLQIVAPQMATTTFAPIKWHVKTLLKDLNLALDMAKQQGTAIPMSGLAAQLMALHGSHGFLDQDPATFIKLFEQECCVRKSET